MIVSHDSDDNSRRSISYVQMKIHRGLRGRDSVVGITRICSGGDQTHACDDLLIQVSMLLNSHRKVRTDTGWEIPGLIGRPSWIFCEKVAFQFPGKEGDDFDFDEEVAGPLERLCGTASRQPS